MNSTKAKEQRRAFIKALGNKEPETIEDFNIGICRRIVALLNTCEITRIHFTFQLNVAPITAFNQRKFNLSGHWKTDPNMPSNRLWRAFDPLSELTRVYKCDAFFSGFEVAGFYYPQAFSKVMEYIDKKLMWFTLSGEHPAVQCVYNTTRNETCLDDYGTPKFLYDE